MKTFYLNIILLTVFANSSFAQTIVELYESIPKTRNWKTTLVLSNDFRAFSEDYKVGIILFESGEKKVELIVFEKIAMNDSIFQANWETYTASSSCQNYITNSPYRIGAFQTEEFLIIPLLCPKCDFRNDTSCKKLAKTIWNLSIHNY